MLRSDSHAHLPCGALRTFGVLLVKQTEYRIRFDWHILKSLCLGRAFTHIVCTGALSVLADTQHICATNAATSQSLQCLIGLVQRIDRHRGLDRNLSRQG